MDNDLFGIDDQNNDILAHLDDDALHNKNQWPGDLVELAEVIRAQLLKEAVGDDETYRQIERVLLAMSFLCGGRSYYLPKGNRIRKALRDKRLYDEFNGKNLHRLVKRYQISEQKVYEIIREQRQLHMDRTQHKLFGNEQG